MNELQREGIGGRGTEREGDLFHTSGACGGCHYCCYCSLAGSGDCSLPLPQNISCMTAEAMSAVVPTHGPRGPLPGSRKAEEGYKSVTCPKTATSTRTGGCLGDHLLCYPTPLSEQKSGKVGEGLSLSPSETPILGCTHPRQQLTPPHRETEVQRQQLI